MLKVTPSDLPSPCRILAVGCHSDDIEIGCGGTLLTLIDSLPSVEICWLVLSARGERAAEARRSAEAFLEGAASAEVILHEYRDGFLPYVGADVKQLFEDLKPFAPDLVFTHYSDDRHQDHRLAAELTWNTFRNHLILEYEIPKYDGDFGSPNVFVGLSRPVADRKVDLLLEHFRTQRDRRWFTGDLFTAVMRIRGMESNSPSGLAEGFYGRKVVVTVPAPAGAGSASEGSELTPLPRPRPLLDTV
ncbi:MAG TPA: PIG-L deacetylase family protein [Gaiellaceae bacterium]|nr:PIG-L deacetylase family protein [Gaiellaceae bacterium]